MGVWSNEWRGPLLEHRAEVIPLHSNKPVSTTHMQWVHVNMKRDTWRGQIRCRDVPVSGGFGLWHVQRGLLAVCPQLQNWEMLASKLAFKTKYNDYCIAELLCCYSRVRALT